MGQPVSVLILSVAIVFAAGGAGLWLALRSLNRLARTQARQTRDHALAAQPTLVAKPPAVPDIMLPDPCDPQLSERQRLDAMRTLLQHGDDRHRQSAPAPVQPFAATQPLDDMQSTTPMAWHPEPQSPAMQRAESDHQPA